MSRRRKPVTIKTRLILDYDASLFHEACNKAQNALAIQVEKDVRPYVPTKTGNLLHSAVVTGNVVRYVTPYARYLHYGKVMVDPDLHTVGFPIGAGGAKKIRARRQGYEQTRGSFRSRRGVKKVAVDKAIIVGSGTTGWFWEAKKARIGRWRNRAAKEIEKYG